MRKNRPKAKNSSNKTFSNKKTKRLKKTKESQLSLFNNKKIRLFGGALLKGNAKIARPLSTKEAVHLVLKSAQAIGSKSMLQRFNVNKINQIIRSHAKVCRIRIYHLVNVGNHLHLVIKLDDIKEFRRFIRVITGLIARHVLKIERGVAAIGDTTEFDAKSRLKKKYKTSFWVARPFTRLITWGDDYKYVTQYMKKNINEAKGAFRAWGFDTTDPELIQSLNTG